MKTICLNCGYVQDRKSWAKTQQRCNVCRSSKFIMANREKNTVNEVDEVNEIENMLKNTMNEVKNELNKVKNEVNKVKKLKVNDTVDNRKIGTMKDISMLPVSNPKPKKENKPKRENKEGIDKRRESWRRNELLHQQGRREQTGLIREAVQLVGSIISEKNPKGHGSKVINHAFKIAEIKRAINDEGGDTRLLGENMRALTGDNDSILGLGFVKFGKGGILERFRREE